MLTLNKKECAPIMLEALNMGILMAQFPNADAGCRYRKQLYSPDGLRYSVAPCVIGTLIDDATARLWDKVGGVRCVENERLVRFDDVDWFAGMQEAHDNGELGELKRYLEEEIARH